MITATDDLNYDDYILRIDGQHFGWIVEHAKQMLNLAVNMTAIA
jgi:hypothetical protein